jgi:hypothetical protein
MLVVGDGRGACCFPGEVGLGTLNVQVGWRGTGLSEWKRLARPLAKSLSVPR